MNRKGCGKLRHVSVGQLWVQQLADEEEVKLRQVLGDGNPADLSTTYLIRPRMDKLIQLIYLKDKEGRTEEGLYI